MCHIPAVGISTNLQLISVHLCYHDAGDQGGYVVGGISPVGQRKKLPMLIDASAEVLERVYVSAGRRGLEIALRPGDLAALCEARFAPLER